MSPPEIDDIIGCFRAFFFIAGAALLEAGVVNGHEPGFLSAGFLCVGASIVMPAKRSLK